MYLVLMPAVLLSLMMISVLHCTVTNITVLFEQSVTDKDTVYTNSRQKEDLPKAHSNK